MTKIEFINRMSKACSEAIQGGARFNQEVIYAQAALESSWGNSELAKRANNIFAIKAENTWTGETIFLPASEWNPKYGWYNTTARWRKYSSWTECILDYSRIISTLPWYQDALMHMNEPKLFLQAILPNGSQPGWATDPHYTEKIMKIASEMEGFGGPKWV